MLQYKKKLHSRVRAIVKGYLIILVVILGFLPIMAIIKYINREESDNSGYGFVIGLALYILFTNGCQSMIIIIFICLYAWQLKIDSNA